MNQDEIIGLEFPNGRVCWCPRSVLISATGSYFAARFGSGPLAAGAARPGDHGRTVYFIARDGDLFEKFVLQFLLTNYPGRLPPFHTDRELWRALRREAEFYGLDGLSSLLHVTYSCEPNNDGKGIIHWLGTDKGQEKYQNPHQRGTAHVGGWVDWPAEQKASVAARFRHLARSPYHSSESSRSALVQYRPPVREYDANENDEDEFTLDALDTCKIIWCGFSRYRLPLVVDLKSTSVRLTHYSLRYGECMGMSHWNLEASQDGENWDVLHEARGDMLIRGPSDDELQSLKSVAERNYSSDELSLFLTAHVEN